MALRLSMPAASSLASSVTTSWPAKQRRTTNAVNLKGDSDEQSESINSGPELDPGRNQTRAGRRRRLDESGQYGAPAARSSIGAVPNGQGHQCERVAGQHRDAREARDVDEPSGHPNRLRTGGAERSSHARDNAICA